MSFVMYARLLVHDPGRVEFRLRMALKFAALAASTNESQAPIYKAWSEWISTAGCHNVVTKYLVLIPDDGD